MTGTPPQPADGDDMRRSYVLVLVFWGLVLAGLYAFQEYFAVR